MSAQLELAREVYDALGTADAPRLVELMHPDFVGHVSEGMPEGVGGVHRGPRAMLADVWAPIARRFAVRPVAERFLPCDGGDVVVLGTYAGAPPGSDTPLRAAFAHALSFRDGRVVELRQITDTQRWADAASRQRLAVVRRMFEAVERRDAETLLGTYADDIEITEPPSLPYGGVYRGHEGAIRHGLAYVDVWDPLQTPADRQTDAVFLDSGDRVVVRWRQKGTAADGRRFEGDVVDLAEVRDGRVTSLRMFHADTAAVLDFLDGAATAPS